MCIPVDREVKNLQKVKKKSKNVLAIFRGVKKYQPNKLLNNMKLLRMAFSNKVFALKNFPKTLNFLLKLTKKTSCLQFPNPTGVGGNLFIVLLYMLVHFF